MMRLYERVCQTIGNLRERIEGRQRHVTAVLFAGVRSDTTDHLKSNDHRKSTDHWKSASKLSDFCKSRHSWVPDHW